MSQAGWEPPGGELSVLWWKAPEMTPGVLGGSLMLYGTFSAAPHFSQLSQQCPLRPCRGVWVVQGRAILATKAPSPLPPAPYRPQGPERFVASGSESSPLCLTQTISHPKTHLLLPGMQTSPWLSTLEPPKIG